jgi:hypothetical protein
LLDKKLPDLLVTGLSAQRAEAADARGAAHQGREPGAGGTRRRKFDEKQRKYREHREHIGKYREHTGKFMGKI